MGHGSRYKYRVQTDVGWIIKDCLSHMFAGPLNPGATLISQQLLAMVLWIIKYTTFIFLLILNLEGHQNCTGVSKVTAIFDEFV